MNLTELKRVAMQPLPDQALIALSPATVLKLIEMVEKAVEIREEAGELVEALEKLKLYIAHNGDDWVQGIARDALAKYRAKVGTP